MGRNSKKVLISIYCANFCSKSTPCNEDNKPSKDGQKSQRVLRGFKAFGSALACMGQIGAAVDGAMQLISFINMLGNDGPADSPELAYMKAEFNIVQSKLDKLVQGQTRIEAGVKLLTAVNHVNLNAIRKLYKDDLPKLKSSIKNDLKSGGITLQTQRKVENFVENIKNDRIETRYYYYIYQTIT